MTGQPVRHPATYPDAVLHTMAHTIDHACWAGHFNEPVTILDPFAGIGKVHQLRELCNVHVATQGVEIEPEWANQHPGTMVGNALYLPDDWAGRWDVVATSPCYGNRMADHHEAKDKCSACLGTGNQPTSGAGPCRKCRGSGRSPRRSYRHDLGRPLHPLNTGQLQWGRQYRSEHQAAWGEVERVLGPGGLFLLNVKDHYRDGRRMRVAEWHRRAVMGRQFSHLATYRVPTSGNRYGANGTARVAYELLYVFERMGL